MECNRLQPLPVGKPCVKNLFIKWLTEWKNEAANKGSKMQYTYAKAASSLKRYPLSVTSGKECVVLEGFGPKICQMLDTYLESFLSEQDLNEQIDMSGNDVSDASSHKRKESVSRKKMQNSPGSRSHTAAYIPRKGSGGYALIITLYKTCKGVGGDAFMTKKQLMEAAQPLSEQSFTVPPAGSHYTAWSSMGILIKKSLVERKSSPAKYYITEAGCKLAEKLVAVENASPLKVGHTVYNNKQQAAKQKPKGSRPKSHKTKNVVEDRSNMQSGSEATETFVGDDLQHPVLPMHSFANRLNFVYVDSEGNDVMCKDQAAVLIDESITVGFLVRVKLDDLLLSGKRHKLDSTRDCQSGHVFAFLQNEDAPDVSTEDLLANCNAAHHLRTALTRDSAHISGSVLQSVQSDSTNVLRNKSFHVILCVDTQEYSNGSYNRDLLIKTLDKQRVCYEVRKLQVGDFVWIAQCVEDNTQEFVLDYIVERKRMDDLSKSIVDGRFREQKHRLRNCGVKNVIYLIEEYGQMQHFSIPEETLNRAIINTQIVNGFYVKRTQSTTETAEYLAIMTRFIQSEYMSRLRTNETLLTFKQFNSSSVKTKALCLTEMFAKHLMNIRGLTAEKASCIVKYFPTQSALIEALDNCKSDEERHQMLASLKYGTTQRNIGGSLSQMIATVYCSVANRR